MTADPSQWFAHTVDKDLAYVSFAAEFMVFNLAKMVDQATFDAALNMTLGAIGCVQPEPTDAPVTEWEADFLDRPVPMVPTQRGES